jgi:hypothetical protein
MMTLCRTADLIARASGITASAVRPLYLNQG